MSQLCWSPRTVSFVCLTLRTLLIAQSHTMDHLNNRGNLNRIKLALADNSLGLQKTLDMIMKGLQQVVPYHHASIHIKEAHGVLGLCNPSPILRLTEGKELVIAHFINSY